MDKSGKGAKVIQEPTAVSKKKRAPGGPAIVSDNLTSYQYAMELLGSNYSRWISLYPSVSSAPSSAPPAPRSVSPPAPVRSDLPPSMPAPLGLGPLPVLPQLGPLPRLSPR